VLYKICKLPPEISAQTKIGLKPG